MELVKPDQRIINSDMSLAEILAALTAHDEGIEELGPMVLRLLSGLLIRKVDGCRYKLDELTDEAERHAKYAKEHTEKKRALEAQVARLKNYVVYAMQESKFDKITGDQWRATLLRHESVSTVREPHALDAINHPEFVKPSYTWRKDAIKDAINKGNEFDFAKIAESFSPRFTVNSEKK